MKRLLCLALFTVSGLFGCGGGSSETATPQTPAAATASLDVSVQGLPEDTSADVTVTGPDGFSQTITGSETLTGLAAGTYTLTPGNVDVDGVTFDVQPAEQTVTLSNNSNETVSLVYQAPISSDGVISNFGSVYVNGLRFTTTDTTFETDGSDDASEDELDIGMVVSVQGRATADGSIAQASHVAYHVSALGPVDAISLTDSTFTLLGQTFHVDELTLFEDVTFDALIVGDIVEVSAYVDDAIGLVASRVELKDDTITTFRVSGTAENLDQDASTFTLNALTVDYSDASVDGTLSDGADVRVVASAAPVDGVLTADAVHVEDDDDSVGQVALDGVITSMSDDMTFVVADQTVRWSEETDFYGGEDDDLTVGLRVKVFGLYADDVLDAVGIRLDKPGVIKLEGPVSAVDPDASTLTVLNTVFTVDAHTRLLDKSSQGVRRMTLDDFAIGDEVDIKAFQEGDVLLTRLIKRNEAAGESDSSEIEMSGRVTAIDAPEFTIQGVTVITNAVTQFELDDEDVDADTFFAALSVGDEVELEGQVQSDGSVLALEVEFEDEERGNSERHRVKVKGVIQNVVSEEEFVVNGRSIYINASTRFEDGNIDDIVVDALVKVKGIENDDGDIVASKIDFDREDESEDVEVEGEIDAFESATDFSVDGVSVTTSEETEFEDGTADDLALGVMVEVKGVMNDAVLEAMSVSFKDTDDDVEVTGVISGFESPEAFYVGEQAVTTTSDTEYDNGNRLRLADGEQVDIEGRLNEEDVLVAREVTFAERDEAEIEGEVSEVLSDSQFSIGDIFVFIDSATIFKKGTADDIAVGVYLEVEGYENSEGVVAEIIVFSEAEDEDD
ncbi:DUF5666 domain-containing protein [Alteromonas sp. CYL-A6]|uniref:DUF5666 domain-containing protein n=1 Tax=Alteromonas nitratireducens TaxID=3390813 RepID=UPI0034AC9347